MKKSAWLIGLLGLAQLGWAQSQKEVITKTGHFTNTAGPRVLSVENIQGNVQVVATKGDQIELTAEKTIAAKTQPMMEKGMREVELKMVESGDTVYVYLVAPFIQRNKRRSQNYNKDRDFGHNSEDTNLEVPVKVEMNASNNPAVEVSYNRDKADYDYNFDMILRVPEKIDLIASTVIKGDVEVSNIIGDIKAHNVNGPIRLTGVAGQVNVNTINGSIDVSFANNPTGNSEFKTFNGEVRVNYRPNLNATVVFKSILHGQGQFYTDLANLKPVPGRLTKNTERGSAATVYQVDTRQNYQVGKGGITLLFETLNGNMYLQKK